MRSGRAVFFNGPVKYEAIQVSTCTHCYKDCIWFGERMLVPGTSTAPQPNEDLPPACLEDYAEASDILARSPRGAAALLRLCIQKLCAELEPTNDGINDAIRRLVAKGLPEEAQIGA